MVGLGESFFPAFALAVGLSEVTAGLTASIPLLGGAALQLVSPYGVRWLGSPRRWVILCSVVQSLAFVPFIFGAWAGTMPASVLLLVASVYWAGGLGAGPAWNTWMGRLVPQSVRASFFAARTRITQITVFVGLLGGGTVLHICGNSRTTLPFVILFVLASCFRLTSTGCLIRMREPQAPPAPDRRVSLGLFARRLFHNEGRLFAYMLAMTMGTHFAAPYFTPYMLKELKLPYATYVLLLAVAFMAKVLVLPLAARLARRYSVRHLLWIGGLGVAPLAGLWILSSNLTYLLAIQLLAGACWAAYELATFLLIYEAVPDEERVSVLTVFTLVNAVAIVAGASLGGWFLHALGQDRTAYLLLFGISTLGRLAALPLLRGVIQMPLVPAVIGVRTLGIRPSAGTINGPILDTIPNREEIEDGSDAHAPIV